MRALIIGGGIGGLAGGLALRGAGLDVTVFERASEFREVGAGLTLWANAVKGLDALGVSAALREGSLQGQQGGIHTWRGRTLLEISPREMERLTGAPSVAVHRADLIDLLAGALGRERVRLNCECLDFLQNDDGVIARFANGSVAHGDLLIGADGIRSVVRARLFGDQPPRYAGYVAWRGVLPFDTSHLKVGEYLGCGQRFGLVPLRGGRLYWFATATLPPNAPPSADGEQAELLRRFADWCTPIPEVIRRTDPAAILRNEICDRDPIDRWGEGRVTLLGDAAHPMTPNLGQGACQAIEDAVELGRQLSSDRDPSAIPATLRSYEARRTPRTRRIVLLSRRYGRMAQADTPLGCWIRDRILSLTPRRMQLRQMAGIVNG